jgi:hypothetical protein
MSPKFVETKNLVARSADGRVAPKPHLDSQSAPKFFALQIV